MYECQGAEDICCPLIVSDAGFLSSIDAQDKIHAVDLNFENTPTD
ncbi:MAG: hypothetical protein ACRC62_16100 [Microcoleus sp.]